MKWPTKSNLAALANARSLEQYHGFQCSSMSMEVSAVLRIATEVTSQQSNKRIMCLVHEVETLQARGVNCEVLLLVAVFDDVGFIFVSGDVRCWNVL